jgi:hypothetical protein
MNTQQTAFERLMQANLDAVYHALDKMPASKKDAIVEQLLKEADLEYDEKAHSEPWRNQVADDLNQILGRVIFELETSADEADIEFAFAALRIVERVAGFEQISEVDEAADEREKNFYAQCEPHHAGDDENLANEEA